MEGDALNPARNKLAFAVLDRYYVNSLDPPIGKILGYLDVAKREQFTLKKIYILCNVTKQK